MDNYVLWEEKGLTVSDEYIVTKVPRHSLTGHSKKLLKKRRLKKM